MTATLATDSQCCTVALSICFWDPFRFICFGFLFQSRIDFLYSGLYGSLGSVITCPKDGLVPHKRAHSIVSCRNMNSLNISSAMARILYFEFPGTEKIQLIIAREDKIILSKPFSHSIDFDKGPP